MLFYDRNEAGIKLGEALKNRDFQDPRVFGLPRGGVVVAAPVARVLHACVEIVVARKIGVPGQAEYGIGALSEDGLPLFNPEVLSYFDPRNPEIRQVVNEEMLELHRRIELYRDGKKVGDLGGKTAILVDDGIATGVTAAAAGKYLRTLHPLRIVLAVPVSPKRISKFVSEYFDEIISLHSLEHFHGVGQWYQNFDQVEDEEVLKILRQDHLSAIKNY